MVGEVGWDVEDKAERLLKTRVGEKAEDGLSNVQSTPSLQRERSLDSRVSMKVVGQY